MLRENRITLLEQRKPTALGCSYFHLLSKRLGLEAEKTMELEEKEEFFKKLFYQKWGSYENYLKHNPPKKKKKYKQLIKDNLWLKVRGDELWFSPEGTKEMFFLTDKKITWEEIKNKKLCSHPNIT